MQCPAVLQFTWDLKLKVEYQPILCKFKESGKGRSILVLMKQKQIALPLHPIVLLGLTCARSKASVYSYTEQ